MFYIYNKFVNLEKKMQRIFINKDIFDSDADYIIGGFHTDKTERFELSDFKFALRDRIERLVQEYLNTANNVNRELGYLEDSTEKANENLGLILKDNLDIFVPYTQVNIVVDSIFDHPKVQKWIMKINDKISISNTSVKGIRNESNSSSTTAEEKRNAEYFTNASFEEFIEKIYTIQL
jgi:hypothetical protein